MSRSGRTSTWKHGFNVPCSTPERCRELLGSEATAAAQRGEGHRGQSAEPLLLADRAVAGHRHHWRRSCGNKERAGMPDDEQHAGEGACVPPQTWASWKRRPAGSPPGRARTCKMLSLFSVVCAEQLSEDVICKLRLAGPMPPKWKLYEYFCCSTWSNLVHTMSCYTKAFDTQLQLCTASDSE